MSNFKNFSWILFQTKVFCRSFLYEPESTSCSFGTQANFIFIIGDYLQRENYEFIESNCIAQGSEVLKTIMESQMTLAVKSGNWYAILNENTGFKHVDIDQFKRMIEVIKQNHANLQNICLQN